MVGVGDGGKVRERESSTGGREMECEGGGTSGCLCPREGGAIREV